MAALAVNRATFITDIIALLQASAKTKLAALPDDAIEFGLRTFSQIFAVKYRTGVLVGLSDGSLDALTVAATHQDVQQGIQIIIYKIGHDPVNDQKDVIAILEEIEEELWAGNMTLSGGGTILTEPRIYWGPPIGRAEVTLHWAVLEVTYQKTATL